MVVVGLLLGLPAVGALYQALNVGASPRAFRRRVGSWTSAAGACILSVSAKAHLR